MSRIMSGPLHATILVAAIAFSWEVTAQDPEGYVNQPYIDAIKEQLEKGEGPARTSQNPQPYIYSIKKDLPPEEAQEGYIEAIQEKLQAEADGERPPSGSYISREKARLGPARQESAIGNLYEGKSDLKMTRDIENIHHAAGFRLGTAFSFDISGSAAMTSGSFTTTYGEGWNPDFTLFYEYQPFHSEWIGNIGIWGSLGFSHFTGNGHFVGTPPVKPWGGSFTAESRTEFQFSAMPVMAGLNYRMNILRIFRPYVMAGPALIGYLERRNDGGPTFRGTSKALYLSGGVAFLLDWVSRDSTWALYQEFGVKHFYLTVEFVKLTTLEGEVNFDQSGLFSGLTFEF